MSLFSLLLALIDNGSNLPSLGFIRIQPNREANPAIRCIETQPEKSTKPSLKRKPFPNVQPIAKGNTIKAIKIE